MENKIIAMSAIAMAATPAIATIVLIMVGNY